MNIGRKIIGTGFFILLLSSFEANEIQAQSESEDVKKAFQTANTGLLSNHFGETLTLNIEGKEEHCTKSEAHQDLQEFFSDHKVRSFEIKFEGQKDKSNFIIGTLNTDSEKYRVSIFFRKDDMNNIVHLLRIEKDHGSAF
jgi:hypothetical protein